MSDIKERLRLSATGMCGQGELDWASMCCEAADYIDLLESYVVANQKDAERYRWLRHVDNDEYVMGMYELTVNGCSMFLYRNERLDAAIDTFISGEDSVR